MLTESEQYLHKRYLSEIRIILLGNQIRFKIMTKQVSGETPFQILAHSFSVSPSTSGYTLAYSADGANFSNYTEVTPSNEVLICNGVAKNMWFKLVGNNDEVTITY